MKLANQKTGQLFIAMAHYEGETLQEKASRQQLPVAGVTGLTIQISQGLVKAHAHGLVHRDLKPANILVIMLVKKFR